MHTSKPSAAWRRTRESGITEANAYVVRSDLRLFSNFTYFMNDPVNGDQFEQNDKRTLSGVNAKHTWFTKWAGRDVENSAGIQLRNDSIDVGLFNTVARQRSSTTRADHVVETSGAGALGHRRRDDKRTRTCELTFS